MAPAQGHPQPGQKFAVRPYFVKKRQEANAGSITVTVPAHQHLNAAFWVHLLLVSSRAGGHAIQGHLFRPLDASKARFAEQGVSSSSINSYLQSVLKAGVVFTGQTAHSMRRSALIHARDRGASTEQLMDMAMINTAEVLKRRYLDPGRHVTASQRAQRQRPSDGALPARWASTYCIDCFCTEICPSPVTPHPHSRHCCTPACSCLTSSTWSAGAPDTTALACRMRSSVTAQVLSTQPRPLTLSQQWRTHFPTPVTTYNVASDNAGSHKLYGTSVEKRLQ